MKAVATLISMTFIILGAAILIGASSSPILALETGNASFYEACFGQP